MAYTKERARASSRHNRTDTSTHRDRGSVHRSNPDRVPSPREENDTEPYLTKTVAPVDSY